MKRHRSLHILGLTWLLLVGVSCGTSDSGLTGVPDAQPAQQPSALLGDLGGVVDALGGTLDGTLDGLSDGSLTDALGGALGGVSELTGLLTCSEQPYAVVTKRIGSSGGTIKVGEHELYIPMGALAQTVTIRAEQVPGSVNSVRFSPEGLKFEKPAALTMSYKNCLPVPLPKTIVYTTEKFKILEILLSLDLFKKQTVSAPIDHFSRYAVAY